MEDIKNEAEEKMNMVKATKQELLSAYKELLKKYQDRQAILPDSSPAADKSKPEPRYKTQSEISQSINAVKMAADSALREVEEKINNKFTESKQLDEQILKQQARLKDLYGIEKEAGALWAILEAENEARRQAQLEKEEASQKRRREEEDYRFNFELQKRKDKEAFDAEKRKFDSDLEAKKAEFIQKEKEFNQKSGEFESLKKQVAEFPEILQKEKQMLEAKIRAEAKFDKDTALLIVKKDADAQKSVFDSRILSLEASINDQKAIAESLREQLKAAQAQVQEVVLKSIEGTSGAKTLEAVNKLTIEQLRANNPQK